MKNFGFPSLVAAICLGILLHSPLGFAQPSDVQLDESLGQVDELSGNDTDRDRRHRKHRKEWHKAKREFCRENPDDADCERYRERQEMKKICQDNREDERCIAFKQERKQRRSKLRALCAENPDDEQCKKLKRHKRHKRRHRRHKGESS